MGASLAGEGLIRSMLPDAAWRPLAVSFGYTLVFMIVVLGRQQLFTENTITAILPLLDGKDKLRKLAQVLRLWSVVLVTNIVGAGCFAFAAAHSTIFSSDVQAAFVTIGHEAAAPGFASGWLIALMVWMLPGADTNRPFIVLLITYFVGLGSFSHIIAGSVETLYLVAIGQLTWAQYALGFLVPVFIGNVIGGSSLVALLNYGQIVAEG
jgi:formate/nitrite transporter FocA (FNT family)